MKSGDLVKIKNFTDWMDGSCALANNEVWPGIWDVQLFAGGLKMHSPRITLAKDFLEIVSEAG